MLNFSPQSNKHVNKIWEFYMKRFNQVLRTAKNLFIIYFKKKSEIAIFCPIIHCMKNIPKKKPLRNPQNTCLLLFKILDEISWWQKKSETWSKIKSNSYLKKCHFHFSFCKAAIISPVQQILTPTKKIKVF